MGIIVADEIKTRQKVLVEFINTCPCCDAHARTIEDIAKRYPDVFEVKIYRAGKDFDYLKKYGPITKGTLIVGGSIRIDNLSRSIIENVMKDASTGGGAPSE